LANAVRNNLNGTVPTELSQLEEMRDIDFSSNALEGTVPDMSNLLSLEAISFGDNNLNGPLPESMYGMEKLKTIDLS
jgi:hypothetical protein